jgi:hypothetical protein
VIRESPTRWLRAIAGLAVLVVAGRSLQHHGGDFALLPIAWHFDPLKLLIAGAFIVVSFLCLALSWQSVARGWRQRVGLAAAARAWALTNLARYRPSHGEAVPRMAAIAERAGVGETFAVTAAVVPRLVTLASASAVASGLYVLNRIDASLPSVLIGCLTVAGSLAAAVLLTSSDVAWRISVMIRRPNAIRPLEPDALGLSTVLDIAGFLAQGAALQFLALGMMASTNLTWWVATGSLAAAYVVGRLVPVLPSGFPVREAVLFLLLRATVGTAAALALSLLWRGILTLFEVGAALPFLLTRSETRDAS